MELQEIKNIIKKKLVSMYNVPQDAHIESFTLPPYSDPLTSIPASETKAKADYQAFIAKYNIVPQEAYNVLLKLEINPRNITKDERVLRKKYMLIVKKNL